MRLGLERVTLGGAKAAGRLGVNRSEGIGASGRTARLIADVFVRAVEVGASRRIRIRFLLLQCPTRLGAIDLLEVGNASALLAQRTGFDKVRDRNGGQQGDNGHYNHDFY